MYWQYQTIVFEFRKDGLLGDKYIDDEEVENILNEQGRLGWDLVSVTPVQDGLLAFLKKEIRPVVKQARVEPVSGTADDRQAREDTEKNRGPAIVRDSELVGRADRKQKNPVKGGNDMIGGIKIS